MAGVREARKLQTRERVLEAARQLFVDIGYEAATIRMIADHAGVATGSVFTAFPSKLAILRAVMDERLERLCEELESVARNLRGGTVDGLSTIMACHYDFEMRRPRLFTAFLSANFEWSEADPIITFGQQDRLNAILKEVLRRGIENGEVAPDLDQDLFIELLIAAYGFNYRHAAQAGADARELSDLMDRQIQLLFDGIAARR